MKIAVFGLTISSSWGNGHATLWRGLVRALSDLGHEVTFFEHDVPYYAETRDLATLPPPAKLILYTSWREVAANARAEIRAADVVIVTSFCADAIAAIQLMLTDARGIRAFYDLDTPVTLGRLERGEKVPYLPSDGLHAFDIVLSFTGGSTLDLLRNKLGACRVAALYGHVDPGRHWSGRARPEFRSSLSFIGTYAQDRQDALERFFLAAARRRQEARFVIAGSCYPADFRWEQNIYYVRHLPPVDHADFYASSRLTLNITRADMAAYGFCPSGRLFEAAACGAPLISDVWPGLETFFKPGEEILVAKTTDDVLAALDRSDRDLRHMAEAARQRVLDEHTSRGRASELIAILGALTEDQRTVA